MEWAQLIIFFVAIFGLWLWNRSESNQDRREAAAHREADRRELIANREADRRELLSLLKEMKDEMKDFKDEMKEFHIKHLILEERYLQLREKK